MGWPNLARNPLLWSKEKNATVRLKNVFQYAIQLTENVFHYYVQSKSLLCSESMFVAIRNRSKFRIIKNHVLSPPDFFVIKLTKSVIKKNILFKVDIIIICIKSY